MPFAGGFLNFFGVSLQKLITIPKGRGVIVKENSMIIDPFAFFSSPKITGIIDNLDLGKEDITITFKKRPTVTFPKRIVRCKNDLLLYKGDVKIGKMRVVNTYMQIVDNDPKDLMEFHIQKYFRQVSRASISVKPDQSIVVMLPDYSDVLPQK